MAGKDRVGALYYEVILDPRKFSKGVFNVRSEQQIMERALRNSSTKFQKLQAELDAIGKMAVKASGEQRKVLGAEQRRIVKQMEEILHQERQAKRKHREDEAKAEQKRLSDSLKTQESKNAFMQKARDKAAARRKKDLADQQKEEQRLASERAKRAANAEKQARAHMRVDSMRAAHKQKIEADVRKSVAWTMKLERMRMAEEVRLEKLRKQHAREQGIRRSQRLMDFEKAFSNLNRMRTWLLEVKRTAQEGGAALSRMLGNLAQAAGMGPAMQGLLRVLGMLGLKALVIAGAFIALAAAMTKAIAAADRMAKQVNLMKVLLGGNEQLTRALTRELNDYASRTSYTVDQMMDMAAQMRTLGVEYSKLGKMTKLVGNLALGDPVKAKLITKAYTDVVANGRLMTVEARQFANHSVPIWDALAKTMGKTVAEIKEMTEQGLVSVEDTERALERINEDRGGRDALEAQMMTVSGQWEIMKGLFGQIMQMLGASSHDFLARVLAGLNKMLEVIVKIMRYSEDLVYVMTSIEYVLFPVKKLMDGILWVAGMTTRQTQEQAIAEEKIAEEKRRQEKLDLEAKRLKEEQMAEYDRMKESLLDQLRTKEEIYKRDVDRLVVEGKITKIQARQLKHVYDMVESQKQREKDREEAAKKAEEKRKEQEKKDEDRAKAIKKRRDDLQKKLDDIEKDRQRRVDDARRNLADNMSKIDAWRDRKIAEFGQANTAASSFQAGSTGEYDFMKQQALARRGDKNAEHWEKEADKKRSQMLKAQRGILKAIKKKADDDKNDAMLGGSLIVPIP